MLDATLVIVNYGSGDRLARQLDTLAPLFPRTVVLDNASRDGSQRAAEGRAAVELIRSPANTGFAAGANRAVAAAPSEATWLLFLNPDAHPTADAVKALLSDIPDDVGAVAALQTDEAGNPRSESGGYRPSLPRYAVWALLPSAMHGRFGPWLAAPFPQHDVELPWVSGAVLAVRRESFQRVGGFDERNFLYQEDVLLCERLHDIGQRVVLRGGVRVFHEVANGEPSRRAAEMRHAVAALGARFHGVGRVVLGIELTAGFAIRGLLGNRDARSALSAAIRLLAPPAGQP